MTAPAPATLFTLLRRIAAGISPNHKAFAGPYALIHGDQMWAVACDGRMMLWVKHSGSGTDDATYDDPLPLMSPGAMEFYTRYFDCADPSPLTCNLGDLKAWCGAPLWTQPCPACKGTSAESQHVSCSFCDDEGVMSGDSRPGRLRSALIDRNLLAQMLEPFEDAQTVEIRLAPHPMGAITDKTDWVQVRCDQFRALLMGMTMTPENQLPDEPRFPQE